MGPSADPAKQAFIQLHDRLGRRLMSYLVRRVHDKEVAAELWAESWAVAFENWHRCRADHPAAEEAWVFGIARNQLAGYYRSGSIQSRALQRLQWTVPTIDGELDEELERVVDREALRQAFADALRTLPPKRREALRLRIIDGLDYQDVAAALRCSEQAARAHVSRGLKGLARELDAHELQMTEVMI